MLGVDQNGNCVHCGVAVKSTAGCQNRHCYPLVVSSSSTIIIGSADQIHHANFISGANHVKNPYYDKCLKLEELVEKIDSLVVCAAIDNPLKVCEDIKKLIDSFKG
jgi:CRISPR/Cas system-associated protein Csx1